MAASKCDAKLAGKNLGPRGDGEREPIMKVWGQSPRRSPWAGQGVRPKAESFSALSWPFCPKICVLCKTKNFVGRLGAKPPGSGLEFYTLFRFQPYFCHRYAILHRTTRLFRLDPTIRTSQCSYDVISFLTRRQPRRRKFTFGFVFVLVTHTRTPKFICRLQTKLWRDISICD